MQGKEFFQAGAWVEREGVVEVGDGGEVGGKDMLYEKWVIVVSGRGIAEGMLAVEERVGW